MNRIRSPPKHDQPRADSMVSSFPESGYPGPCSVFESQQLSNGECLLRCGALRVHNGGLSHEIGYDGDGD